jgi:hypothetical protein
MFQTHYAKQRPRQRWEGDKGPLLTQLESLLYSLAPDDVLFVKDRIYTEFKNKVRGDRKAFDAAIEDLCKKGFFKEIHGNRILNLIKSY